MSEYCIPTSVATGSPFKPSPALVRAAAAAVFNRDLADDDKLCVAELAVTLGYKVLMDMGHEQTHAQTIFRFFKDLIEEWSAAFEVWHVHMGRPYNKIKLKPDPIMLEIIDNKYALMLDGKKRSKLLDIREGVATTRRGWPVIQVAVQLSALTELVLDTQGSDWYRHLLAGESAAAAPAIRSDSPRTE